MKKLISLALAFAVAAAPITVHAAETATTQFTPLEYLQTYFPNSQAYAPYLAKLDHVVIVQGQSAEGAGENDLFGNTTLRAASHTDTCKVSLTTQPDNVLQSIKDLLLFEVDPSVKINAEELALYSMLHEVLGHCADTANARGGIYDRIVVNETQADAAALNTIRAINPTSNTPDVVLALHTLFDTTGSAQPVKRALDGESIAAIFPDFVELMSITRNAADMQAGYKVAPMAVSPYILKAGLFEGVPQKDIFQLNRIVGLYYLSDYLKTIAEGQDDPRVALADQYLDAFKTILPTLSAKSQTVYNVAVKPHFESIKLVPPS